MGPTGVFPSVLLGFFVSDTRGRAKTGLLGAGSGAQKPSRPLAKNLSFPPRMDLGFACAPLISAQGKWDLLRRQDSLAGGGVVGGLPRYLRTPEDGKSAPPPANEMREARNIISGNMPPAAGGVGISAL